MSERLNQTQNDEAKNLYDQHRAAAEDLWSSRDQRRSLEDAQNAAVSISVRAEDSNPEKAERVDEARATFDQSIDRLLPIAQEHVSEDQKTYDANLWQSSQHFNKHKEEYQNEAIHDAESAGKTTNFGQSE